MTSLSNTGTSGNSAEDWMIFEILCGTSEEKLPQSPSTTPSTSSPPPQRIEGGDSCAGGTSGVIEHHHNTSIDLVTALRSELAALTYKRDRLSNELIDTKNALCSRESECESLRAQAARQSALIGSLQARLQSAENREHSVQMRCDTTIDTIQREKRSADERCKELQCKIQHLETHLTSEESHREQLKVQLQELLRRLGLCLGLDVCESGPLSAECVVTRVEELMIELQRNKAKINSTCDTLSSCETELLNLKSLANIEKQRLSAQLESSDHHNHELESRCRQYERELQVQRDRLTEAEINGEKLKEELRGFESRCHRLQNSLERTQSDRLQVLRGFAMQLNVPEPCETLIKDKVRETLSENQMMHLKLHSLQDQLSSQQELLKEAQETSQSRLRSEEAERCELEERVEKCNAEIHTLRQDHLGLSEYLQRLARALNWSECSMPPALGGDTNMMAENLLERIQQVVREHSIVAQGHSHDRNSADRVREYVKRLGPDSLRMTDICCARPHHHHHHMQTQSNLRRERSCQDIPLKESSNVYTLQRRVRILREQVQRRDMHLELLRRKLAIIEDGARGKCALQGELDEAVSQLRKANKQVDKLSAQLVEARSQLSEVKAQLAESVEYKITALERARKIDELTAQICDLEGERTRLQAQLSSSRERLKLSTDSAQNRRCRDETLINSLRDDVLRLQTQLSESNHRLSQLQSFRTSVARILHLRDLPETDLLQRLQALCTAHQEFTLLSRRYETASPVGDHPCPRFDDPVPPSVRCRPPREVILSPSKKCEHAHHAGRHHCHHSSAEKHHRHRSKSRARDKRPSDDYFDGDAHRQSCKDDFKMDNVRCGDTDEFDFKNRYC